MTIFNQNNNKCYFIHIPRTGGRFVSSLFENSKDVDYEYNDYSSKQTPHLQYPLYNEFLDICDMPHITVVRNPYDKFLSSIRMMNQLHQIDYNEVLNSYENFLEFVNYEIELGSQENRWFLPQHNFISSKTYFWKYEWGFGENFRDWIYKKTKIKINLTEVDYEKHSLETPERYNYKLNKNIKHYVKRYYKEDYKKFKYFW